MIVLIAIGAYFAIAIPAGVLFGRRLRKQRELAQRMPVVTQVRDEQLDITSALQRSK